MTLLDQLRPLLNDAQTLYMGTEHQQFLGEVQARIDEPLRVAIAGKVKAGKSTLLNALVGEELAPTDAGECTKIVTWYRDGLTYRVLLHPAQGDPIQLPFDREDGALEIDLKGYQASQIERLVVDWPSASLREMTLIDTPGIESLSSEVSARTTRFLGEDAEQPASADAVLYLMRHLHATDIRFLESFHDRDMASPTPVNSVGILSRADEIGAGRIDAMNSAGRIAERYRQDRKVRQLCQTVVPVAGLLAETGTTLREEEYQALKKLALSPREDVDALLLSADRFMNLDSPVDLLPIQRQDLLYRLGIFGVRVSLMLIRHGRAENAGQLSSQLVRRSGLNELRQVLIQQFAARRDLLKARSTVLALESVLRSPLTGSERIEADLERIVSGAHEFEELRLLNAARSGATPFSDADLPVVERILGASGEEATARLGLSHDASSQELAQATAEQLSYWRRKSENPLSSQELKLASRVLVRSLEAILIALSV
ncbi:MAG: dynamin family protein [Acidimicrobiales bacterium]